METQPYRLQEAIVVAQIERYEAEERSEVSAVGHIAVTRRNAEHLPGLFRHLTLEHAAILESLLELQHAVAEGRNPQPLLSRTLHTIAAHETAESAVLESRLPDDSRARHYFEQTEDGAEKVLRVGRLLERLVGTSEYARTLEQLVAMFQQHSRHEETELFSTAQSAFDASDPAVSQEYERVKAATSQETAA